MARYTIANRAFQALDRPRIRCYAHVMAARYVLARDLRYRMITRTDVELRVPGGESITLPLTWYLIVSKLTHPTTIERACEAFGVEVSEQPLLARAFERMQQLGILRREASARDGDGASILDVLEPSVLRGSNKRQISRALRAGRMVVIPNAVRPKLADAVHRALKQTSAWKPHQGLYGNFFFSHHNIYDEWAFPKALRAMQAVFTSTATCDLMGELSGEDCSSVQPAFSASLYLPGDYSLPHTDSDHSRTVAFVWHLTKHWDRTWGGALYWCPSGVSLMPSFNTLVLFVVSKASKHIVTTVAPHARGHRLGVNGWWRGKVRAGRAKEETVRAPTQSKVLADMRAPYGARAKIICGGRVGIA
jgi:Rps23 Pro-64 3,4-dihydroxylase Tpa1-like proline 4-hydroxylase